MIDPRIKEIRGHLARLPIGSQTKLANNIGVAVSSLNRILVQHAERTRRDEILAKAVDEARAMWDSYSRSK